MKVLCQFCAESFQDFEPYRDHIKSQHIDDVNLNIKLEPITFAKEYKCTNCDFAWIYKTKQDNLCIYEIEGQRYCLNCKNDSICSKRLD